MVEIPVWRKLNLSVKEAAAYSGIGEHKIENMLSDTNCDFLLIKGTHRMIKRKQFEAYIDKLKAI